MKTAVLLIIVFVEAMFHSMPYPFVAYMVADFFYWLDRNDKETDKIVSFYAGLVASCFSLAQFISSFVWGGLSDRKGRRPILLIGMLGNAITAPLFGLAPNYTLAVIFRSLSGLINGNVGVARAYAREISDETNTEKIFSYLGFAWGIGVLIGPIIGGGLSNVTGRFPSVFTPGGFWDDYPYLLPMLVNSCIILTGLCVGYFAIEDVPRKQIKGQGSEVLTKNRDFLVSTAIYAISGLAFLSFQEIFPLWCRALKQNGGLGFEDSGPIGLIQSLGGVSVIVFQLFLVPWASAKYGILFVMKLAWFLCLPVFFFTPFFSYVYGVAMWLGISFLYLVFSAVQSCVLTAIGIGINNSVSSDLVGTANGAAQSAVSLFRFIGPAAAGGIFGWSTSNGMGFPFNAHFIFILDMLLGVVSLALLFSLNEKVNKRKESINNDLSVPLISNQKSNQN